MNIEKDLNFIIGKNLIQIRMNLYTIDLIFEDSILITVGYKTTYTERGTNRQQKWDYTNNQNFAINKLLGNCILRAEIDVNYNLILEFENKRTLMIESERAEGESYIIYNSDDFQVIN